MSRPESWPKSWDERWSSFARATRPGWRLFPEWLEAGLALARPAEERKKGSRYLSYGGRIGRVLFGRRTRRMPLVVAGGCETLLFAHSAVDNVRRPVRELGDRLAARGGRALVWSYEGVRLHSPPPRHRGGGPGVLELGHAFAGVGPGFAPRAWILCRAAVSAGALSFVLAVRGSAGLRPLALRPLHLWAALAESLLRIARAEIVVRRLGVKRILVTHERHSPGADFLLAPSVRRKGSGIETILYLHAPPIAFEFPVLSRSVLAWNRPMARLLGERADSVRAVGNWELDLWRSERPAGDAGGPALVFLSQCACRDDERNRARTAEALAWIARAARARPEWSFWIKERAYDDEVHALVAAAGLGELPNVRILDRSETYASLLARPAVRAVAAYSSSGLYVAAGAGKRALRLLIPAIAPPIPLVDDVARPVAGAAALIDELDGAAVAAPPPDGELFPFRGETLSRIESLLVSPCALRPA